MFKNFKIPTFIVNKQICIKNIEKMFGKAEENSLVFRPHFKTHQSIDIGKWFRQCGVDKITVSSLSMAEYFSGDGWNDISVAFPVNIREIDRINELASKITLNLVVISPETLEFLQNNLTSKISFLIEIKINFHRSGIDYSKFDEIIHLIKLSQKSAKTEYIGLISHFGETYKCRSKEEIKLAYNYSASILTSLNNQVMDEMNYSKEKSIISIGDTPSCSVIDNFDGIDELRPGNLVFYDLMQFQIGSCNYDERGCYMLCPIVEINKSSKIIVIYGGSVHFNKDTIIWKGKAIFGLLCKLDENFNILKVYDNSPLSILSQEHGQVEINDPELLEEIKIGEMIAIIPVHSCLTANQQKNYFTESNEILNKM